MPDYSRPDMSNQRIPDYAEIPQAVKDDASRMPARSKWHRLMCDWFFCGLSHLDLKPKPGVDANHALFCLRDLLNTRSIKHEHKTAAFIWLASQWLDDATWETEKP